MELFLWRLFVWGGLLRRVSASWKVILVKWWYPLVCNYFLKWNFPYSSILRFLSTLFYTILCNVCEQNPKLHGRMWEVGGLDRIFFKSLTLFDFWLTAPHVFLSIHEYPNCGGHLSQQDYSISSCHVDKRVFASIVIFTVALRHHSRSLMSFVQF